MSAAAATRETRHYGMSGSQATGIVVACLVVLLTLLATLPG
jgi:hypothetical protein